MTLVEKIKSLCDDRGITFAALERRLDFGNGTIRKWDNATPSGDKLARVADFFNVSVDYLLGRNEDDSQISGLDKLYFSIAKDAQDNGIDPEDLRAVIGIIAKRKKEK